MRIVCVKALCLMCLMIALRLDEVTAEKKRSLKARIGCKYSVSKDSSMREKIRLLNTLESEGLLPSNSVTKVAFGWISEDEMAILVRDALVKSGRIPRYCLNKETSSFSSTTIAATTLAVTTTKPSTTTTTTKSKTIITKPSTTITTSTPLTKTTSTKAAAASTSLKTLLRSTGSSNKLQESVEKQIISTSMTYTYLLSTTHSATFDDFKHFTIETKGGKLNLSNNMSPATTKSVKEFQIVEEDDWYREFVMDQLPDKMREMIEDGRMPLYLEEAIFSGTHNRSVLAKMIADNDVVMRGLLPDRVLNMLEDRPIPVELKALVMSGKNETEIRREIEKNDSLLQQLMKPSTYFFYKLFSVPRNQHINIAINVILIITLTAVMTSLGCTMTIKEIKEHARKPKGVLIALVAQFIIMPAASYGLIVAFGLKDFAAIAVLICGCCPGGNLSNILAYALKGDMNLSILMTTCSSVLGLALMPLNIFLYSKLIIPLDSGQVVPFDKIVINIALTIFPVGIGIAIRHFRPHWVKNVMRVGAVILLLNSITVAILSGTMFGTSFFFHFPLSVVACCAILPLIGYIFGYLFGWIGRESPKCVRTISVETGCQNVQLCTTVLKLAFDPVLVGVLFLMPLIYMGFQVLEALLMIVSFRLYHRFRSGKNKESEYYSSETKKKADIISLNKDDKETETLHEKTDKPMIETNGRLQNHAAEEQPLVANRKSSRLDSARSIDYESVV